MSCSGTNTAQGVIHLKLPPNYYSFVLWLTSGQCTYPILTATQFLRFKSSGIDQRVRYVNPILTLTAADFEASTGPVASDPAHSSACPAGSSATASGIVADQSRDACMYLSGSTGWRLFATAFVTDEQTSCGSAQSASSRVRRCCCRSARPRPGRTRSARSTGSACSPPLRSSGVWAIVPASTGSAVGVTDRESVRIARRNRVRSDRQILRLAFDGVQLPISSTASLAICGPSSRRRRTSAARAPAAST